MEIFALHTGGTICCESRDGFLAPSGSVIPEFKAIEKEFKTSLPMRFTHKRLTPFLSETLSGLHLNRIGQEVQKAVSSGKYSAVIITHGSDTIAYTTAFLSYIFGSECIPIVTVCADLPISDGRSSAHLNLRAAAVLASSDEKGVFSVYRDSGSSALVFRGSRTVRQSAYQSDLNGVSFPYGKINLSDPKNPKIIKEPRYSECEDGIIFDLPKLKRNSPVVCITATPGAIYPTIRSGWGAVILGAYHSGTIDTSSKELIRFARECKKKNVALFIDAQGANEDYESMRPYAELGIMRLPPLISPTAAYIKLWLLIEKGEKQLSEILYRSCGGDLPTSN